MALIKQLPKWTSPGVEPPESLKTGGFQAGYKPPAPYFNWLFHTTYEGLKELHDHWSDKVEVRDKVTNEELLELIGQSASQVEPDGVITDGEIDIMLGL